MTHELGILFGAGFIYLLLLFLVAYAADSGRIPERLIRHPLVYALSLGVYATSWSYYGSVGFAQSEGYLFLTIYIGVTLAFALTPVLLQPILRLTREYQLTSLADLFAFRFRSQLAGVLVTLFMLIGTLPYIALQIRAVTESMRILTQEATPQVLAFGFCLTLILFAILFGARHVSPREKHQGLVVAIAFESLVKLLALITIGLFALFGIFSGPSELNQWLAANPQAVDSLYQPVREGPWLTLLFLAFAAAFLLPRQFHMLFAENLDPRAIRTASWAFPLYLFLINLAIPPILWAGSRAGVSLDADYFVLGITLDSGTSWLPTLAFIGGVSAASAMVIVTTVALSSMVLNHILLPWVYPYPQVNLYRWLQSSRRVIIGAIILAGYAFYVLLQQNQRLVELGLISFVAVAQFLPGIIGLLYWKRANRNGFIAGLMGGMLVWGITLLVPLLDASGFIRSEIDITTMQTVTGLSKWEFSSFFSISLNLLLFVTGSLLTRQSRGERDAAGACCTESFTPLSGVVSASSTEQFTQELSLVLGWEAAEKEVQQALSDLGMSPTETRPAELRQLRERIERNLSGLIGPQLAHIIINRRLSLDTHAKTALADSMRYVEERLEESRSRLQGMTADLDNLRRYQRQILLDLPLGVCTVDREHSVVIWNLAMEVMTDLPAQDAVGVTLHRLPAPWGNLLSGFASAQDLHIHHMEVKHQGKSRWFNLHKATIPSPVPADHPVEQARTSQVMLLEDLTNLETLEAELEHSDRLASIGRLAAGVAHEIGNPVTGIASLAQNLRHEREPELIDESIEEILRQTQRISTIIQTLMNFSRSDPLGKNFHQFPLREVVDEAIRLVRLTRNGRQVECLNAAPAGLALFGDRQSLSQVLVNLFSNACDASVPGDRVELLARENGKRVIIEILDQGCGIDEQQQAFIFEPFFTTKPVGEGTGLGLAMAYKIISDHNGSIELDSQPGVGTRVIIELPKQAESIHAADTDH